MRDFGKNQKNSNKKYTKNGGGSNGIVAWAKMHIKQRNIYLTVCRLPN